MVRYKYLALGFGILALVMVVMFLGLKISSLEKQRVIDSGRMVPKYKTMEKAIRAYGQELGLELDDLMGCVERGEKKAVVEADLKAAETLGLLGTPSFFINGKYLFGAMPLAAFEEVVEAELTGTASADYRDYQHPLLRAAGAAAEPEFIPVPREVEKSDAPVTILAYMDFQCGPSSQVQPTLERLKARYEEKVSIVLKHYPLKEGHPLAQMAAEAYECAKDQGKGEGMDHLLYTRQDEWATIER